MSEENNKTQSEDRQVNDTPLSKEENTGEEQKKCGGNCDEGKACAVLAYFAIGIIWYFVDEKMKKNDFVKFHVKQALGLLIADLVLMTALTLSVVGIMAVPLLKLVALVLVVVGIMNAVNGDKKELPFIGVYTRKYLKF